MLAPQEVKKLFRGAPRSSLWMENSTTSCPDVNYWCRVRLANPASRSSAAESTKLRLSSTCSHRICCQHHSPRVCVYKYTFRSLKVLWCASDKIRDFFVYHKCWNLLWRRRKFLRVFTCAAMSISLFTFSFFPTSVFRKSRRQPASEKRRKTGIIVRNVPPFSALFCRNRLIFNAFNMPVKMLIIYSFPCLL